MFKNNFFYRTPPVAASDGPIHFFTLLCNVSKIAMKACFPSYRNKSRDIRLVSMSRENETLSNVARKKIPDYIGFLINKHQCQSLFFIKLQAFHLHTPRKRQKTKGFLKIKN